MKKNIIAMAVAAAVAAPAAAIADTTLYGKIHASYDVFGGDNASNQDYSFSSNSSRIGIKGKEQISDGLALIYKWEEAVDWGDTGGGIGGARNTYVGFTGDWGTALAGRHDTPMKGVGRKYDLFGDTVGDSRAIIRGRGANSAAGGNTVGFDERMNNVLVYATPDMGGFNAMVAYVSDWDTETVDGTTRTYDSNKFDAWSVSAGYSVGGFSIDGAYEIHNAADMNGDGDTFATDSEEAYRVGAGYKMGGFKIVGLYQSISDLGFVDGAEVDMWGLGGAYSFGNSTIKAQYYTADDVDGVNDSAADLWAVGYDYKMSKQTSVYAAYGSMTSDSGDYVLASGTGHGESPVLDATGEDSNSFSVGIVHKF
ncbi:porin [Guyparkeria halophila]|uniref:Porin n=1 Tax=Guyparkeria halophila TaxID=47960 RepID=A0ABZ0YZ46_9GAMM|nr:porin [Guyparkeria halophila]WQH16809.1 porin [Guyparkeria halophila]